MSDEHVEWKTHCEMTAMCMRCKLDDGESHFACLVMLTHVTFPDWAYAQRRVPIPVLMYPPAAISV